MGLWSMKSYPSNYGDDEIMGSPFLDPRQWERTSHDEWEEGDSHERDKEDYLAKFKCEEKEPEQAEYESKYGSKATQQKTIWYQAILMVAINYIKVPIN